MEMTSLSLPFPRWLIMRPSENMKQTGGDEIGHGFFPELGSGENSGEGEEEKRFEKICAGRRDGSATRERRGEKEEEEEGKREIPGSPSGLGGNPGSGLSGVKKRGEGEGGE